jgi:hypothetical protein
MPSKILICILVTLLLVESTYVLLNRHPINRFKPVDQDGYVAFDTATGQLCRSYRSKTPEGVAQAASASSLPRQSQSRSGDDPILAMIERGNPDPQSKEKAEVELVRGLPACENLR